MGITVTLGKSGQFVLPKQLCNQLGLQEGSRLRLDVLGGKLEATPEAANLPIIQNTPPLAEQTIVAAIKADRK